MTTTDEVDASLQQQVKRHEALKKILQLIADLRKQDDEGADWVVEQIGEG
jgi:hypothetical protein